MTVATATDCLVFIAQFMRANGVAPSCDEIADGVGLRSKSSVHDRIKQLERAGKIRRLERRARGIEIVHQPSPRQTSSHKYQAHLALIDALEGPIPKPIHKAVALQNVKLGSSLNHSPAPRTRKGNSLGGEVSGMSPAVEGFHSGPKS